MNQDQPETTKGLLDELSDLNSLLDKAINKAKHIEKDPNLLKSYQSTQPEATIEEDKIVKPSNWDSVKNNALEDSIDAMEDDPVDDTRKARQVKPKKKPVLDDNWEDDPF